MEFRGLLVLIFSCIKLIYLNLVQLIVEKMIFILDVIKGIKWNFVEKILSIKCIQWVFDNYLFYFICFNMNIKQFFENYELEIWFLENFC